MYEQKGLIDIHCHILPGIDDGAQNEKESLKMFRMAADAGIREMIATPHFHYKRGNAKPAKVKELAVKMQERLDEMEIPIRLHSGNELYYSHSLLDVVKAGEALTMADSDYVLLEFSPEAERRKIQNAVYHFLCEGYNPIIAHVERYRTFLKHSDFSDEISRMGAYLQVNAGSITGGAGWKIQHFSKTLAKKGYVSFLATDAHDLKKRTPQFGKSLSWIEDKLGRECLWEMTAGNPEKILSNKTI